MSNVPQYRTEAELKTSIEAMRSQLSQSLADLSHQAQPKVQAEYAKEAASKKVDELKEEAAATIRGILHGDRESLMRAAKILGVSVAVVALLVLRANRKKLRRAEVQQWRRLVKQLGRVTPPASLTFTVE